MNSLLKSQIKITWCSKLQKSNLNQNLLINNSASRQEIHWILLLHFLFFIMPNLFCNELHQADAGPDYIQDISTFRLQWICCKMKKVFHTMILTKHSIKLVRYGLMYSNNEDYEDHLCSEMTKHTPHTTWFRTETNISTTKNQNRRDINPQFI